MSGDELFVFFVSIIFALLFSAGWYGTLMRAWLPKQSAKVMLFLKFLPLGTGALVLLLLNTLAASDVRSSGLYILLYLLFWFVWIELGMKMISAFFDLSWIDDVVHLGNRAALFPVVSGFLSISAIYAAANIGEGPGWWCVLVAGFLGVASWFILGLILRVTTGVFERITVDRDINAGLRVGAYLLASGLILGRASAGDWTSFEKTLQEFQIGWPVLILTALAIVVELQAKRPKSDESFDGILEPTVETRFPLQGRTIFFSSLYLLGAFVFLWFSQLESFTAITTGVFGGGF